MCDAGFPPNHCFFIKNSVTNIQLYGFIFIKCMILNFLVCDNILQRLSIKRPETSRFLSSNGRKHIKILVRLQSSLSKQQLTDRSIFMEITTQKNYIACKNERFFCLVSSAIIGIFIFHLQNIKLFQSISIGYQNSLRIPYLHMRQFKYQLKGNSLRIFRVFKQ